MRLRSQVAQAKPCHLNRGCGPFGSIKQRSFADLRLSMEQKRLQVAALPRLANSSQFARMVDEHAARTQRLGIEKWVLHGFRGSGSGRAFKPSFQFFTPKLGQLLQNHASRALPAAQLRAQR